MLYAMIFAVGGSLLLCTLIMFWLQIKDAQERLKNENKGRN